MCHKLPMGSGIAGTPSAPPRRFSLAVSSSNFGWDLRRKRPDPSSGGEQRHMLPVQVLLWLHSEPQPTPERGSSAEPPYLN